MISQYRSLRDSAEIEYIEKKSRFIGVAAPLQNTKEAEAFVQKQRERFPDATHHVFAWIIIKPQRIQRFSDAGEPQGTAGLPVFDVLDKQDLVQAGIVIVRYFGGIKLGAGGLVRAYGKAATLAVEKAKPIIWQNHRLFHLTCDYTYAEKVRYQLELLNYHQLEIEYTDQVSWQVAVEPTEEERFLILLKDLTSDKIKVEKGKMQEFPISE